MTDISEKTIKVLEFVTNFHKNNGYSPSLNEIMTATGIKSLRGVTLQLDKLAQTGYIQRNKQKPRAIKILASRIDMKEEKTIKVPLVGEIPAGMPILAEQNIEEYREVPQYMLHGRSDAFLLRVKGNSMLKANIKSGDIVIVVPQPVPDNGDIVVALFPGENEATLKRYKKLDGYIALLPESDDPLYQPIIGKEFTIQGKLIGKL